MRMNQHWWGGEENNYTFYKRLINGGGYVFIPRTELKMNKNYIFCTIPNIEISVAWLGNRASSTKIESNNEADVP